MRKDVEGIIKGMISKFNCNFTVSTHPVDGSRASEERGSKSISVNKADVALEA